MGLARPESIEYVSYLRCSVVLWSMSIDYSTADIGMHRERAQSPAQAGDVLQQQPTDAHITDCLGCVDPHLSQARGDSCSL